MQNFAMDAGSAWGMFIFAAGAGVVVGAVAHSWIAKRAQEAQAKIAQLTDQASVKANEVAAKVNDVAKSL